MRRRILPCFLCICFLLSGCSNLEISDVEYESKQVLQDQKKLDSQVAIGSGIQVVAKRPYIRRGETGVMALKCEPNAACKVVVSYKINGKEYQAIKNIVAGEDGNVLCTWKVDSNADTGTYEIEITSGESRLITNYMVQ